MSVANDASESPETRESTNELEPATEHQLELAALTEIVAVQAQALNDVINSANNLQARMAALEERLNTPVTNGKKDNKIIRLN